MRKTCLGKDSVSGLSHKWLIIPKNPMHVRASVFARQKKSNFCIRFTLRSKSLLHKCVSDNLAVLTYEWQTDENAATTKKTNNNNKENTPNWIPNEGFLCLHLSCSYCQWMFTSLPNIYINLTSRQTKSKGAPAAALKLREISAGPKQCATE